jgi:hypothetical protein
MTAPTSAIPLARQVQAAQRELRLRRQVYPRLVHAGRMTQEDATDELACMAAIVETLARLCAEGSTQLTLEGLV